MKKSIAIALIATLCLMACSKSDDNSLNTKDTNTLSLLFSFNWDGKIVTKNNLNTTTYTNAKGNKLSITRLRYLISKVTLKKDDSEIVLDGYHLADISKPETLIFNPKKNIEASEYDISFTFGFNDEDNYKKGGYTDLNADAFDVPGMMAGGYHYMQMDGKYTDNENTEQNYNYHAIRAVMPGMNGNQPVLKEKTFFKVNLGKIKITKNTEAEVKMNIAEWYTTPIEWDLNTLNVKLMMNPSAQKKMYDNGKSGVFSLGKVK